MSFSNSGKCKHYMSFQFAFVHEFIGLRCACMSRFWFVLSNFHFFLAKQEEASVKGASIWLTCLHHKFRPDFVEAHHLHLHMQVELGTV